MFDLPIGLTEDDAQYNGPLSTYKEWHSATIGAAVGVATVVASLLSPAAAAPMLALSVRLVHLALTGKRVDIAGRTLDLPGAIRSQIRSEPHYCVGAWAAVILIGSLLTELGLAKWLLSTFTEVTING